MRKYASSLENDDLLKLAYDLGILANESDLNKIAEAAEEYNNLIKFAEEWAIQGYMDQMEKDAAFNLRWLKPLYSGIKSGFKAFRGAPKLEGGFLRRTATAARNAFKQGRKVFRGQYTRANNLFAKAHPTSAIGTAAGTAEAATKGIGESVQTINPKTGVPFGKKLKYIAMGGVGAAPFMYSLGRSSGKKRIPMYTTRPY